MSLIPIAELEMTINRCREHLVEVRGKPGLQPLDPALEDLATLAGVYGMMIYRGQSSITCSEQGDAVQGAIARWVICSSGNEERHQEVEQVSAPPLAELPDLPNEEQRTHDQE